MKAYRLAAAGLALGLLTGCASLLERSYTTSEPHSSKFWESEAAATLRAENRQDMVNDLLILIGQHTETASLRLYNFPDEQTALEELEKAAQEVQQETPLGAYAVEYITYISQPQRSCFEADLQIGYRRTAEQMQTIVSASSVSALGDLLEAALDGIFNDKDNTYTIINMESMTDAMNLMTSMMMSLLVGIASIALVVGGIGIMNMMLVTVTERTTEIGLRKALGAEPGQIQMQFLIEAIILSLLGGVIGVIVGLSVSFAICMNTDITFSLNTFAIGLGVGFSAAVGIIFGGAPARKASRLNPIDALRSM